MIFRETLVEMFGTFTIVFLVSKARISSELNSESDSLLLPLVAGFAQIVLVLLSFPRHKCHFTPLLTFVDLVFGQLSLTQSLLIAFSQFSACLIAHAMVVLTLTDGQIDSLAGHSGIGVAHLRKGFDSINGFYGEMAFAAIFVFVCGEFSKRKAQGAARSVETYALARGAAAMLVSLVGNPVCGGDLNPFATVTGSLVSMRVDPRSWVFFISPLIGATMAGLVHSKEMVDKFLGAFKEEGKKKKRPAVKQAQVKKAFDEDD